MVVDRPNQVSLLPRRANPNPPRPLPSGPLGARTAGRIAGSSLGVDILGGCSLSPPRLWFAVVSGLGDEELGSYSSLPDDDCGTVRRVSNCRLSFPLWFPRPRPRPCGVCLPSDLGGVTAPGDEAPDDGADSPKILALASSYRRCFSSRSRFCRARICSGVGCGSLGASSSSSSTESWAMPVTGSRLATTGLRLRTLTCGLKAEVRGTVLLASTKWKVCWLESLGWM